MEKQVALKRAHVMLIISREKTNYKHSILLMRVT